MATNTPFHFDPHDADLWVLAGQSNMVGAEAVLPPLPPPPDPRIAMLNLDGRWLPAAEPLHRIYEASAPCYREFALNSVPAAQRAQMGRDLDNLREASRKSPIGGYGLGLPFAKALLQATGRPIALIPCALGSTSMADWDPAKKDKGEQAFYGALLARIHAAGGPVKGVLWYQGESESGLTDVYQAKLLGLIDALRRDAQQPDLPFLLVQIGRLVTLDDPANSRGWETIRELQRQTARLRPNVFMVPAADLPLTDHIHVSGAGQQRLGRRLAETALTHVYRQPGHATPLDLASISAENLPNQQALIRVRFSGVSGRLSAPGRPSGFTLRGAKPTPIPTVVYRIDLDPTDPAAVILHIATPLREPLQLYYGGGWDPYLNLVDEKDMAPPAFGPLQVLPPAATQ